MRQDSAIPFVCHPYSVKGIPYFDGALSDTIPIQKAFELGCEKVILLLTLPENTVRTSDKDEKLAARIRKKYPLAAQKLAQRADQYNNGVEMARRLRTEGKVLIIAPDDTCGVSTLSRNTDALYKLYEKGYRDGEQIRSFIQ